MIAKAGKNDFLDYKSAALPVESLMIEHVDLQNPGSFGKPAGQPDISFARRRIPRRMIVHEHESISRLSDNGPKDCREDEPKTRLCFL